MNPQLHIKKTMMVLLTFVTLFSLVAPVMALEDKAAPGGDALTASSQEPGPTDPAELETFLDDLFAKDMEENHIAGAAVSVVKDGKLFFAKGYGYADVDKGIPVDPEQTLFSIGSVTKLFTWTAVMQLVEQGKLDLEADINAYLDFRIPDTYPEPIRLKHLLTHTSGFENRLFGTVTSEAKDLLLPAREYLSSDIWPRINPPGEYVNYSNYNAILAGYIAARVSGQPYDQYIQEHIFDPLGMVNSTVRLQIPPDLRPFVSVGYTYADGAFQVFPDYTGHPAGAPSGSIHATVTDMARFMIAYLQNGCYSEADTTEGCILKGSTVQQMRNTLYTSDPRILGNAHGFFDYSDNGQWTLGHRGYLPPMHSTLLLLPDQNLGVFVTYNSEGARRVANVHTGFQRAFFDHYYPASAVKSIQPPEDFAERAGRFVGSYRSTEGSGTTAFKFVGLMEPYVISDPGDGALLFTTPVGEWRFVEVEPLYFRQVGGSFGIAFREDDRGRITHLFFDRFPSMAFEKLAWYETRGFHMALALGCVLIFLSMIPAGLIRFIRDRRPGSDRKPAPRGARVAHSIILGISALNLLFLVGFALGVPELEKNILLDPPLIMKITLGLGVVSAVLTVGALGYTVPAWKSGTWGIVSRVYYTLVTVAAVAFIWFLNYWNLLGWRY